MGSFSKPATSTGVDWSELDGSLLIIEPIKVEEGVPTVHGDSDAVRADLAVVDGDLAGESYDDILVFPKVLQGQLRSKVGEKVLGRLGQGEAKKGQSPPWLLADPTDEDYEAGEAFLNKLSKPGTSSGGSKDEDDIPF